MQRSSLKTQAKKVVSSINWKKWLFVIVIILTAFPLYRYIKKQMLKNEEQDTKIVKDKNYLDNQNPLTQQAKADKITKRKDIQADAKALAHHLGTMYSDKNSWTSIFDWKGWTENDAEAAKIVVRQRLNFNLMVRLYYECYSNSRDLRKDLLELLDEKELKKIQKYKVL